jgi:disulfide bond formation protein DsbB
MIFQFLKLKSAHMILLILSLFAVGASMFSQYTLNKEPCQLCLISRFIYFFILIISSTLIISNKSFLRKVLFISIFILISFAFYHLGVENSWWDGPASCMLELPSLDNIDSERNGPYCNQVNWTIFGLSSTLLNFVLSAFLFWIISISYILNLYINKKDINED